MARNFYVVLGVSRDADLEQIRSAYRRLVKLYHPDAQPQPADKFIELRQAYEALNDPDNRQAHDENLPKEQGVTTPDSSEPMIVSHRRKPLRAKQRRVHPLKEQRQGKFSELDDFFAGWVPGLFREGRQVSRHKDLFVELVLSPAEAQAGGMIPLQVPVELSCPDCKHGLQSGLVCNSCKGRGRVVEHHGIEISVPPGVEDGTRASLPLSEVGLPKVNLIALVTISNENR